MYENDIKVLHNLLNYPAVLNDSEIESINNAIAAFKTLEDMAIPKSTNTISFKSLYKTITNDKDMNLTSTKHGRRYTRYFYTKGILHIVVSVDQTTRDIVAIKMFKIY